jgi:hypothetical protein
MPRLFPNDSLGHGFDHLPEMSNLLRLYRAANASRVLHRGRPPASARQSYKNLPSPDSHHYPPASHGSKHIPQLSTSIRYRMKLSLLFLSFMGAIISSAAPNAVAVPQPEVTDIVCSAPRFHLRSIIHLFHISSFTNQSRTPMSSCTWPCNYNSYCHCYYNPATMICSWKGCIGSQPPTTDCKECSDWLSACGARGLKDCKKVLCQEGPSFCGDCQECK